MRVLLAASSSVRPSTLIPAYNLVVVLRETGAAMIGGFHTLLERECLEILLRGRQTITICPAREFGDGHRLYPGKLWAEVQRGISEGRVGIQSPPGVRGTRITRENAEKRNTYLLEIADRVLILAATEGSRTDAMARDALRRAMPVFVMDHPMNTHLLDAGAHIATVQALAGEAGEGIPTR